MNLLSYDNFKKELTKSLEEMLDDDTRIVIKAVTKNNNIKLDGLIFAKKDSFVSPTIYLNPIYDEYQKNPSLKAITAKIYDNYIKSELPSFLEDVKKFNNYDFIKEKLAVKLINYEKNKDFLSNVPHVRRMDLALVFIYVVEKSKSQNASIIIKNSHLKTWDISLEKLYNDAFDNMIEFMPVKCYSLFKTVFEKEKISELDIKALDPEQKDLYILTNDTKINGAITIFYPNVLENMSKALKSNLYVIPSSVHEVLILPKKDFISQEELNNLVNTVNLTGLSQSEVLSDNVYIYDMYDKTLTK